MVEIGFSWRVRESPIRLVATLFLKDSRKSEQSFGPRNIGEIHVYVARVAIFDVELARFTVDKWLFAKNEITPAASIIVEFIGSPPSRRGKVELVISEVTDRLQKTFEARRGREVVGSARR